MASENILQVSLKEYKASIEELRGSLLGLASDSEQYKTISEEIASKQTKLNEVMSIGKRNVEGSENSLNGMKRKLSELRKEFDKTDVGTDKWKALQKEINETTNKIKDVEEGIGVFGRNVGNYTKSFIQGFQAMGGAAGKIAGPVSTATGAMKAFNLTNPVGWIALAVNAIMSLTSMFGKNEQSTQKLNKAFAVFRPVIDAVTNAFQSLADGLATVIGWLSSGVEWILKIIPGYEEAQKKAEALANAQNQFDEQKRKNKIREAEIENEIAELEEKVADSELNVEDRIAAQNKLVEKKKELVEIKKKELQAELDILKAEAARGANSKEDNDRIAELEASLKSLDGEVSKIDRDSNKVMKRLNNEVAQAEKERAKAAADAAKQRAKEAEEEAKRIADENKKKSELNASAAYENLKLEKELAEKGTDAYIEAAKRLETYEYNKRIQDAKEKITDAETLNHQLELLAVQHSNNLIAIEDETQKIIDENNKKKAEEDSKKKTLKQNNDLAQVGLDSGEDSMDYLVAKQELINQQIQELREEDFANEEEYRQRLIDLQQKQKDNELKIEQNGEKKKEAIRKKQQAAISATTGLLGTISDAYKSNIEAQLEAGKISEKEAKRQFEQVKAMQYANTIISTLSGMMQIFGDSSIPSYYVKAALAATTLVQGLATAQQISQQTIGGNGSVSSGSIQVASVAATPILNEQQDLLNMQTANINNPEESTQKVVIVESDITESNNRVQVREENTTF